MSKHTPGPWKVMLKNNRQVGIFQDEEPYGMAIATMGLILDNPRRDADACLIAAAPEMLEALREALEVGFGERDPTNRATGILRRAVAKAEGRERKKAPAQGA